MIFVKTFPDFHAKIFTLQKCVICSIVHAQYKSVNAFDIMIMICNLGISGKNKHKFMSEPDICVLLERENMFFLEKFIALAKILNCRRQ